LQKCICVMTTHSYLALLTKWPFDFLIIGADHFTGEGHLQEETVVSLKTLVPLQLGFVDKRDSQERLGVSQTGICYGVQLAPRPDDRPGVVVL